MSQPLLSILIPTLQTRMRFFNRVLQELFWQIDAIPDGRKKVEVVHFLDNGEATTGAKRNWLVQNCNGLYVVGFDDDDMPTDVYIQSMLRVAESGADCGALRGLYFLNGIYDRPFRHSIEYTSWWHDQKCYYRNPNHISCIKRELILDIPFKDQTVGEDGHFSIALNESGRLKTEFPLKETVYLYYDRTKQPGQ